MIDFKKVLRPQCTRARISATTQKAALQAASDLLAAEFEDVTARTLLDELMARERLGSTGLGGGVAIPHCRSSDCGAPIAALLTLDEAIDFDAPDDRVVDVLFVLAVPLTEERAHLEILSALAKVFDSETNLEKLRSAQSDEQLYEVMQTELAAAINK